MSFQPGRRLGVFEILAPLGAGGMGEVYRARDRRLGREVALKVLPEAFSKDPEREARMLATLNHAGIAAIHDFQEFDGTRFLVLELVEGETLDLRLLRGALAIQEALDVGCQIAEALEAAHEKGILHRDLKPSNIKRTPEGRIKLLDFGLAKAFEDQSPDRSGTPTLTTPSELPSRQGAILGTAAYMSPEQARGEALDRRTDVWSFGCVLYECLTGRRAFGAPTVAESMAAILEKEPAWEALPATSPEPVRSLLRRCLKKEPSRRLHDIADARLEIEEAAQAQLRGDGPRQAVVSAGKQRWMAQWGLAFLAGAGIVTALASGRWHREPRQTWFPKRLTQALDPVPVHTWDIAVSPDGRRLAYVARAGSWEQIHVRELDQLKSKPVPGTEEGFSPFFSPDGQSLGFTSGVGARKLKAVSLRGGKERLLADAPGLRGASWGPDEIVYAPAEDTGLFRISASGGAPRPLTTLDVAKGETAHCWPRILPGGRAVLFTVIQKGGREEDREIAVVSLATGERRTLLKGGTYPLFSPPGHLLYGSVGAFFAVPFDAARLTLTGSAVSVLEGVRIDSGRQGVAAIDVSTNGVLVYFVAPTPTGQIPLWVDRKGRTEPLTPSRPVSGLPALSQDGRWIAAVIEGDIWVAELTGNRWARITDDRSSSHPVWSRDGRFAFSSLQEDARNLFWARGAFSRPTRLTHNVNSHVPTSFSPDGRLLAFTERNATSFDVGVVDVEGERTPQFVLPDPDAHDLAARFSPDGRWLAYVSSSGAGRSGIYVRPYPGPGDSIQVAAGGHGPLWSRDGRELCYRKGNAVLAVPVRVGASPAFGTASLLFEGTFDSDPYGFGNYDVAADGRFVMLKTPDGPRPPPTVVVVPDWTEELRARLGK